MAAIEYDPPLDAGIAEAVRILHEGGIETFESCQGGEGHAYLGPAVRFHGNHVEGYKAYTIAMNNGLRVRELRRLWMSQDGELVGPYWEMTFSE